MIKVELAELQKGQPGLTPHAGGSLAEACSICLAYNRHGKSVTISVEGSHSAVYEVSRFDITPQMQSSWADIQEATEYGAAGLAILLVCLLVGLTVVQRSAKGTGVDYWLGERDDDYPFTNKARLEVSGILSGTAADRARRMREKQQQTTPSSSSQIPAYVVIVEFSQPIMEVSTV
jgi:hypothetical protein